MLRKYGMLWMTFWQGNLWNSPRGKCWVLVAGVDQIHARRHLILAGRQVSGAFPDSCARDFLGWSWAPQGPQFSHYPGAEGGLGSSLSGDRILKWELSWHREERSSSAWLCATSNCLWAEIRLALLLPTLCSLSVPAFWSIQRFPTCYSPWTHSRDDVIIVWGQPGFARSSFSVGLSRVWGFPDVEHPWAQPCTELLSARKPNQEGVGWAWACLGLERSGRGCSLGCRVEGISEIWQWLNWLLQSSLSLALLALSPEIILVLGLDAKSSFTFMSFSFCTHLVL